MAEPVLALDKSSSPMQIAHHKTNAQDATETGLSVFLLDGSGGADTSAAFAFKTIVKVVSMDAISWIKVGTDVTAVSEEGEPIPQNAWDHMVINAGEKISVIGGKCAIVPIAE